MKHERQHRKTGRNGQKAQGNETLVSEFLDEPTDQSSLSKRCDQAAIGKQIAHARLVIMDVLVQQQWKSGFKTSKAKGGQKVEADQDAKPGMAECMAPLL